MNFFGYMADDLTTMEMTMDRYQNVPNAKALKAALQRAFIEACKASRAMRHADEAGKNAQPTAQGEIEIVDSVKPVRRTAKELLLAISH